MRTSIFLVLAILLTAVTATGQKNKSEESFYIFKRDWSAAPGVEDAAFFGRLKKMNDTCWQWDVYNYNGPLIKSEQYLDGKLSKLHGRQHYFKSSGYMDSTGHKVDGFQHGIWTFLNDTGATVLRKEYVHGMLTRVIDPKIDTVKEKEDKPAWVEVESEFPRGIAGWKKYLEKNLNYPDRAIKASAKGEVVVQFIVDVAGNTSDVDIYRSVEYSIDEESMRLIRKSPKWIAATQNGRPVKSYKRQPLRYQF